MLRYAALLKDTKAYSSLENDIREGRLSHCYMVMGEDALAVDNMIDLFAQTILCKDMGMRQVHNMPKRSKTKIMRTYSSLKISKPTA